MPQVSCLCCLIWHRIRNVHRIVKFRTQALLYSENIHAIETKRFFLCSSEQFHPCGACNVTIMKAHRGAQAQRRQQASKSAHVLRADFLIYAVCDVCKSMRLRSQCAIIVSFRQIQHSTYTRRPTHQLLYMRYNFFLLQLYGSGIFQHTPFTVNVCYLSGEEVYDY